MTWTPGEDGGTRTVESERLRLVPFAEEHLTERYVSWLNDPETVRFSEQRHAVHTLESCRAYWRSFDGTPHRFWAIVAKDPALGHIGNLNAYVDVHNGVADLGILVGEKAALGRGYGAEAWRAASDHLLRDGGVRKLTAGALATNEAIAKVVTRNGMVRDGQRAGQAMWEGREVDVVFWALFAETSSRHQREGR